jgi:hypothetical protein
VHEGCIGVHEGACFQFVNSSPTTGPYPVKPVSIERPLTPLPISHNFVINQSELSEKMAVRMEGAWRVHWGAWGACQRLAYISPTAGPNSMRLVPLESFDLMLFYGGKKSKVYINNRL